MRNIAKFALAFLCFPLLAAPVCSSGHEKTMSGRMLLQSYHYEWCRAELLCTPGEDEVTSKAILCSMSRSMIDCTLAAPYACQREYSIKREDYYTCLGEIRDLLCQPVRQGLVPESCWWRDLTSLMSMFGAPGPDAGP